MVAGEEGFEGKITIESTNPAHFSKIGSILGAYVARHSDVSITLHGPETADAMPTPTYPSFNERYVIWSDPVGSGNERIPIVAKSHLALFCTENDYGDGYGRSNVTRLFTSLKNELDEGVSGLDEYLVFKESQRTGVFFRRSCTIAGIRADKIQQFMEYLDAVGVRNVGQVVKELLSDFTEVLFTPEDHS